MGKFRGVDYYEIDELFDEQERMVRDTARAFADEEVLPVIRAHHRAGTFPTSLIPKMGALGFFGANLKGYGCAGISNVAYGLMMQELERGDSAIRSCASVQGALVMYPIYSFGSVAQKERWLPTLARGEAVGCFGLTEPDHGSDPGGMTTRAMKVKDGFLLNGAKMWITNGTLADVAVVWAKLEGEVCGFLVEKGASGFRAQESEADHLGLIYMAKAGYDPHAARDLWVRMAEASKGSGRPPEFLSTHPSEATRIKQIEAWLPEAMQYYRPTR